MNDAEIETVVREARTVAVLGMKDERDVMGPAYQIPRMLRERGIEVIAVNPEIDGFLSGVSALPRRVDILDVFRRAENVDAHVDEILAMPAELRPPVVWLQTGIINTRAAARLEAAGIRVVMDECLGVWAARLRPRSQG